MDIDKNLVELKDFAKYTFLSGLFFKFNAIKNELKEIIRKNINVNIYFSKTYCELIIEISDGKYRLEKHFGIEEIRHIPIEPIVLDIIYTYAETYKNDLLDIEELRKIEKNYGK